MNIIASKRTSLVAGIGLLLVAGTLLAGCGSKSASASASAAGTSAAVKSSTASSAGAPASTSSPVSGNSNSSFCVEAAAEQAQQEKNADAITGDSPADLQKFEEQGQAELKVFESKAPSQIKSSVQTIAAADDTLVAALKNVNYDITKLDPSVTQTIDTPAFESAVTAVDNYLEKVCGVHPTDDAS